MDMREYGHAGKSRQKRAVELKGAAFQELEQEQRLP
jgi:hypothetical protein